MQQILQRFITLNVICQTCESTETILVSARKRVSIRLSCLECDTSVYLPHRNLFNIVIFRYWPSIEEVETSILNGCYKNTDKSRSIVTTGASKKPENYILFEDIDDSTKFDNEAIPIFAYWFRYKKYPRTFYRRYLHLNTYHRLPIFRKMLHVNMQNLMILDPIIQRHLLIEMERFGLNEKGMSAIVDVVLAPDFKHTIVEFKKLLRKLTYKNFYNSLFLIYGICENLQQNKDTITNIYTCIDLLRRHDIVTDGCLYIFFMNLKTTRLRSEMRNEIKKSCKELIDFIKYQYNEQHIELDTNDTNYYDTTDKEKITNLDEVIDDDDIINNIDCTKWLLLKKN